MTIKTKGGNMVIPRWFLLLVLGAAGIAATAWAGWVTNTCNRVETAIVQIGEMRQDLRWLVQREKEK